MQSDKVQATEDMGPIRRYLWEAMNPPVHVPSERVPAHPNVTARQNRAFEWAAIAWTLLGLGVWPFLPDGWGGYLGVACLVGIAATGCVIEFLIRKPE